MRYTEPEIIGIVDPFAVDTLGDGGGLGDFSQEHLDSPAPPVILPDGEICIYDEFGEIIEG